MTDERTPRDFVEGERDESTVVRAMSTQSRVSNLLAIGLMSVLGLGSLTWYYAHALMREPRVRDGARVSSANQTGDVPLPSLGRIAGPTREAPSVAMATPTPLPEIPLAIASPYPANAAPPQKTPAELALERILSGAVFSTQTGAASSPGAPATAGLPATGPEPGELAVRLHATATPAVRAQVLPAQRLLLPKGAFIDCTLETWSDGFALHATIYQAFTS